MKQKQKVYLRSGLIVLATALFFVLVGCGGQAQTTGGSGSENTQTDSTNTTTPANAPDSSNSTDSAASTYYEGKSINLMVGYDPGGGVDLLARTIAKHLSNHIPGKPSITVQNFPGGGGIAAANVIYNEAKPDGLTIALPGRANWPVAQLTANPAVQFDLNNFEWIGGMGENPSVVLVRSDTGIKTFEDLKNAKKEILIGTHCRECRGFVLAEILKKELSIPIRVISSYGGSGDVQLALERNEIHANTTSESGAKAGAIAEGIQSGTYTIVAVMNKKDNTDPNVIKIEDVISPRAQSMLNFVTSPVGATIIAPPGTNPEALKLLREAFDQLMKDPVFLEDAKKQNIDMNPHNAEETEKLIAELLNTDPEIIKEILEMVK